MEAREITINDRYKLLRKLGEGGMGEVYLAEDPVMQRQVALKFIRGPLGDSESYNPLLERFQKEARTLAKLSHPNIVHVYDYGDHEGRPYLVMEYLPGGSLAERMGKPMPWQEACRLAASVAKALAYAHGEGVLHRDIKPSNILFTKTGEPVVSDFGLARVVDPEGEVGGGSSSASQSLVGSAQPIGTPAYMAPEQWSGLASKQSDIYSLGVVLFEMVTGQVPYPGKTPGEVVTNQLLHPLPLPRRLNPGISPHLEEIIQKALTRDPDCRFQSMSEMSKVLSEATKENEINVVHQYPPITNTTVVSDSYSIKTEHIPRPVIDPEEQRKNGDGFGRKNNSNYKVGITILSVIIVIAISVFIFLNIENKHSGNISNNPGNYSQPLIYTQPTDPVDAPVQVVNTPYSEIIAPSLTPQIEVPTPTQEVRVVVVTATQQQYTPPPQSVTCPGMPPSRVFIGDTANVCTKVDRLRIFKNPSLSAEVIYFMDIGTVFNILDGPICADSSTWWYIETSINSIYYSGWTREGTDSRDKYFICKID